MRNRAMNPPILADKHLSRHEDVKNDDFVRGDNTDEDEDDGHPLNWLVALRKHQGMQIPNRQ